MAIEGAELTPNFRVTVEGTSLQEDVTSLIKSVKYEDNAWIADVIELEVNLAPNLELDPGKTVGKEYGPLLDSKIFAEGNFIDLYMGYGNDLVFMQRCRVQKWLPDFPEADQPRLTVKAFGLESELSSEMSDDDKTYRSFSKMTGSQIVERLIQWLSKKLGVGIIAEVESTAGTKTMALEKGKSPMDIIQELCKHYGYDFYIDYDMDRSSFVAHFHPRKTQAGAKYVFWYNHGDDTTLLSFSPQFGTSDTITDMEVVAWDKKREQPIRYRVTKKEKGVEVKVVPGLSADEMQITDPMGSAAETRFSASGEMVVTVHTSFSSLDQVKAFAEAQMKSAGENMVTAKGKIIGAEVIRSKQTHVIKGVGTRLTGDYMFDIVRHSIDPEGGFMTEFDCRKAMI